MGFYAKELTALKRSGRFRKPLAADEKTIDMASNDYLCLAHRKKLFKRACRRVGRYGWHAPKSSLFVSGHHPIHEDFETRLKTVNGFAAATLFGSGFLANLGLIEALVRRGDVLFLDESYHASGMLATKTVAGDVVTFAHNDPEDLLLKLSQTPVKGRRILAVEGIYSMEGDLLKREFFDIAEWFDMVMLVDEAHSNGVVGPRLLGVFDLYGITPQARHIKMGTLGKAYGSYGAYVLGSEEIVSFLHNRAKSLIYATAPSLFDVALAHEGFDEVARKAKKLGERLRRLRDTIFDAGYPRPQGAIVPIEISDLSTMMAIKEQLRARGFDVGAIRPPTVRRPMLRVILRACVKPKRYRALLEAIDEALDG